jgi:hypothetical protein
MTCVRFTIATSLCLSLGLPLAVGCTPAASVAVMSSSAGAATGAGIERSMSGHAHKTFVDSMDEVETAVRSVIQLMALSLEEAKDTDDGRTLKARADHRRIEIDLERVTPTTTRMSVLAKRNVALFPDEATATEIIMQIAKVLEDSRTNERATRSPS